MKTFPVLVALLLAIFCLPSVQACSCIGRPPCGAARIGDHVFAGTVLSIEAVKRTIPQVGFQVNRRLVHLKVTESFNGTQRVGDEIVVETGVGGGDCGYRFVIGEDYLVDTYNSDGRLMTGICSQTSTLLEATVLLHELRMIASGARLADLAGVVLYREDIQGRASAALRGVELRLTERERGTVYRTVTDAQGFFSIVALPAGVYTVEPTLTVDKVLWRRARGEQETIAIPESRGDSPACHLTLMTLPSGSIAGQVVYASGRPATGLAMVSLNGVAVASQWVPPDNPHFTLDHLKAGSYVLSFRTGVLRTAPSWYYPGTQSVADSTPVEVRYGVTADPYTITVTGQVGK